MTGVEIQSERVDDLPLLVKQQERMGIAEIIDEHIQPHWRRQGVSVGKTVITWLSYILSASDHRMSYVEPWIAKHAETLKQLLARQLSAQDFTDDRLGDVLRYLSNDEAWSDIEQSLGQRVVRVYQLPQAHVRLDSSTVAVYHDPEGTELLRYGYSKDHRPDLAQLKVMLATLDPLGGPLATQIVAGDVADDGLYVPAVDQVRAVLGRRGLLYIGDSKMEALETRAHLVAGGDYYLVPLSLKGDQADLLAELVEPALSGAQELLSAYREPGEGQAGELVMQGYETLRAQEALVGEKLVHWEERLLVIYSPALAAAVARGLQGRLQRAEEKLLALTPLRGRGKRQYEELETLQADAQAILKHHQVSEFLHLTYERQESCRQVRKYKVRPARTKKIVRYQLHVQPNAPAIQAHMHTAGWRLYALHAPVEILTLTDAFWLYRGAPHIERNFSRLKGRPLGLRPVYLQREDHLKGLIRLLSLALLVLTLTEFVVRRNLDAENQALAGLYPGNPQQETQQPTTERLLAAFKEITLTAVSLPDQVLVHITPLTPLQGRILELLDFPTSIYTNLAADVPSIPP